MSLDDDKKKFKELKVAAETYWEKAQTASSPGGTEITESEERTYNMYMKRVDALAKAIEEAEKKQGSSSSAEFPMQVDSRKKSGNGKLLMRIISMMILEDQ